MQNSLLENIIVMLATIALAAIVCLIMQAWRERRKPKYPPEVTQIVDDYLNGRMSKSEYGDAILDEIHRRQEALTPSFTHGLYGDGNKKRGLLHRFLAALGLRNL